LLEEHVDKVLAKKAGKLSKEEESKLMTYKVKADTYNEVELAAIFKEQKIKSPDTGNELSDPIPFNLMFGT
jgi:glycyl-tRNA synthetase